MHTFKVTVPTPSQDITKINGHKNNHDAKYFWQPLRKCNCVWGKEYYNSCMSTQPRPPLPTIAWWTQKIYSDLAKCYYLHAHLWSLLCWGGNVLYLMIQKMQIALSEFFNASVPETGNPVSLFMGYHPPGQRGRWHLEAVAWYLNGVYGT